MIVLAPSYYGFLFIQPKFCIIFVVSDKLIQIYMLIILT